MYVDPLDRRIFYVGKGKGGRALAHLTGRGSPEVARRIRQIRAAGRDPQIEILAHGLLAETPHFASRRR